MVSADNYQAIIFYIGTHKVAGFLGEIAGGETRILRQSVVVKAEGFQKGLITNLEKASKTIQTIFDSLSLNPETDSYDCYVVLGNKKLQSYHFSSSQYYQGVQRTISPHEIRSVVDQTRSVATLPLTEFVLQAIPESFIVNDMTGIRNPLGLEAHRLGVNLKIFTMAFQDFKNIHKVFEAAEIEVKGYYPKTLTLSEGVLTEQEKEEGVLLMDLAADTVHMALWKNGYLAQTKVLDTGGDALSEQIAQRWEIDVHDAEKAKEQYAGYEVNAQFGDEIIPLVERNGKGNHSISRREFQQAFIELATEWMSKIMEEAKSFSETQKVRYPHYVFTGGGTSTDGFLEYLQRQFSIEPRIGRIQKVEAPLELKVDSSLAGGLGLFSWLARYELEQKRLLAPQGIFEKTLSSARHWFATYF